MWFSPTSLPCDKKSTVHITKNEEFHERTRRLKLIITLFSITIAYRAGTIILPFVSTLPQIADFFSKSHTIDFFRQFTSDLSQHCLHREFERGWRVGGRRIRGTRERNSSAQWPTISVIISALDAFRPHDFKMRHTGFRIFV